MDQQRSHTRLEVSSPSPSPFCSGSAETPLQGPVDVDKHCGVINDKGFPCSRSLTCKTHSMGAKRSVPHRSQPYDVLLAEWIRTNKPSLPTNVPGSVENLGAVEGGKVGGEEGKKKERRKKKSAVVSADGGGGVGGKERRVRGGEGGKKGLIIVGEWSDSEDPAAGEDLLDSEEEVEAVLRGLGRISGGGGGGAAPWGRPLSGVVQGGGAGLSASSMFVGRNVKLARLREALGGLFGAH